jgi:hypothetical protein
MSGSILIAEARDDGQSGARRQPTTTQRLLRGGILARLRGLRSGAIRLRDALGETTVGDPAGPLGTVAMDVLDPEFWSAVAAGGDLGAGEAFVAGQWRCPELVRLMQLFVRDRGVLLGVHETIWSLPRRWLLTTTTLATTCSRTSSIRR